MTNKKSTKRALLLSGLALLLCVSLLVGSTYAWFTDSVTSANNKIVAGELDIELYLDKGDGNGYVDISETSESIFNMISNKAQNDNADTLWEPGKTQVAYLKIVNAGSLALKYSVALKITDVTKDLHEVMQYAITPDATRANPAAAWNPANGKAVVLGNQTVTDMDVVMNPGDEHCFALSVHMLEEAGNEYQGGTLNFDLTVLAGQATVESDYFGTDYDKYAEYAYKASAKVEAGKTMYELVAKDKAPQQYNVGYANIPAAAVAAGADKLSLIIEETVYDGNFTVAAGSTVESFDVKVIGLKDGNTTALEVGLKIPQDLDPATVKLYHYDTPIASNYNPTTGYVIFESATFSPFSVVYDADSEYVPAPLIPADMPKADVIEKPEFVGEGKISDQEWNNLGGFYPTEGLDSALEAAYLFKCQETPEEASANKYADWHCDFYVKLDRDLGENQIFLGGNYGSFGWVGFHNGDVTLAANQELGLLESVTTNPWTYDMIANYVGEFLCGVGDVDDALSGATFTVMLRLTNPENAEEYYNVATVKHTFA